MGRHERRAELARYRREAAHELRTFLVEPDDDRLNAVPLLRKATDHWLDALGQRVRTCFVCSSWIAERRNVGAVLISTPNIVRPTAASVTGLCSTCWAADLPNEALEKAALLALRPAVPNGRFEPQDPRR